MSKGQVFTDLREIQIWGIRSHVRLKLETLEDDRFLKESKSLIIKMSDSQLLTRMCARQAEADRCVSYRRPRPYSTTRIDPAIDKGQLASYSRP